MEEARFRGLGTWPLQAIWGASRTSSAKEAILCLLMKGHRCSPYGRRYNTGYVTALATARCGNYRQGALICLTGSSAC